MDTAANKQLMQNVFDELAAGNGQPFIDALADHVRWTAIGTSPWSRTYQGKQTIVAELMRPLFSQFADQYRAQATRMWPGRHRRRRGAGPGHDEVRTRRITRPTATCCAWPMARCRS